jgi:hypothetical protein
MIGMLLSLGPALLSMGWPLPVSDVADHMRLAALLSGRGGSARRCWTVDASGDGGHVRRGGRGGHVRCPCAALLLELSLHVLRELVDGGAQAAQDGRALADIRAR